ncbi:MAG: AIR synthase family protein [Anaerolineae bacterium]|nr:AIR synthase family protein [Anaerolineae bacterium]
MKILPVGKLDPELFCYLLKKFTSLDERVVVGAAFGEDAAVIDMGDHYLVVKSDPITFATDLIGWYAVNVNANDVASMGARPRWMLCTFLLPEGKTTPELAESLFDQVVQASKALGISIIGGHTEVTYGLDRPIVIGHMLGEVSKEKLVTSSGARPGDDIILVKGIPIEGTSIIAREKEQVLRLRGYDDAFIERAKGYLFDPGISVVEAALLAVDTAPIHSMHDPTEGGLAMGLYELAEASGVGFVVDEEAVEVLPEGRILCQEFGLNPLGTIASGALIVTLAPEYSPILVEAFRQRGIRSAVIGRVIPLEEGRWIRRGGEVKPLTLFPQDEITRIF